jgi:thermosome
MVVLSEDSQRTQGEDAQQSNISAGKAVNESVRTTLGPRGMDKMLVSDAEDVVITNDGATILQEMDIEHPAAEMIVEVAESQEAEVGDGTTTAAVLAGQLLAKAEDLLEDDIHPTTIVEGYHKAAEIAVESIDETAIDADLDDDLLAQVAETSMTGKGTGGVAAESLAEAVVEAVRHAERNGTVDRDAVTVHARVGESSTATELVEGIVLDEDPANDMMPAGVEDAAIAVLDVDLEVRTGDVDAEYAVDSVDQLTAARESEERELRGYAETLDHAGVDVVFSTGDIDDRVGAYLGKRGILAFEGLSDDDVQGIARATGAGRIGALEDLADEDFGTADRVRTETYGEDELAFVEGGAVAEAVSLFVRGGTEHVTDELERAITDAVDVVTAAVETGGVVPGAGATEIAVADAVRDAATGTEGRTQLAIEAFADAVDVLPRTLAENTGMDPIDALVDLRATHDAEGRAGIIATGRSGEVGDPVESGVVDPAAVKKEAVESAAEAATMITRIDDVISAE